MSGTVNISRDLWDDTAFRDDEFSQREAWVWMIAEASWKARARRIGSQEITLERGQLAGSVRFFAERWKWTPARVFRYFDMLENRNMIKRSAGTQATVITICKYDEYQSHQRSAETQTEQPARRSRNTVETNEKKGEIRGKEEDTPPPPKGGESAILCEVASPAAVASFMAYRRRHKGGPFTETAARRLAANLRAIMDGGGDPDDALGMAEERGWQTVKPDWYAREKNTAQRNSSNVGTSKGTDRLRAFIGGAD